MRDLGIGDAVDVYWAILYDRTGVFEKQTWDSREKLESELAGTQLAQIDDLLAMRKEMGLDAPAAPRPIAPPSMAEKLDLMAAMREQMMAPPATSPPPDPGSA